MSPSKLEQRVNSMEDVAKSQDDTGAVDTDSSKLEQRANDMSSLDETATRAQTNLNLAKERDPTKEAEYHEMSKRSGYPINVVRNAPEQVTEQLGYPVYTVKDPSGIQRYLGRSDQNATISQNDIPALENVQRSFLDKVSERYKQGKANVEIGNLRTQQLFGDVSEATEKRIQDIKAGLEPAEERTLKTLREEEPGVIEEAFLGAAEQAPILISTGVKALERGLLGASAGAVGATIAGQLGPQVGIPEEIITVPGAALAGFGIGASAGSAEAIFNLEAGLALDEYLDFKDENGQPLDPGIAWAAAVGVGMFNASLEFASLGVLLKTIPGIEKILGRVTTKQITQVLKNPTVRQALTRVFLKFGKAVTIESLTEGGQEAATIIGGELAKLAAEGDFKPVDVPEAVERIKGAAKAAIGPTVVFGLPGSVVGVYQATTTKNQSNDFMENLDKDNVAVNETETAQLSRDHVKEFVKELGPDEDIYISSEGIKNMLLQGSREEGELVLKKIGVDITEAEARIATGEDTTVKSSEIVTLLGEEYALIREDIKPAPGAYTQREISDQRANEDIENSVNVLKEDSARADKINAEIERITDEGKKAGLDEQLSKDAPVLMRGLADRLTLEGVDATEFLQKIQIKKTKIAKIKELLLQADPTEPQGGTPISNENHLIALFEAADLSTVLHEVGHVALKEYTNLELTEQASEALKSDMSTLRKWVGAEAGAGFTTDQLEQFARGFEAYLMEGKAPNVELRTVFERFKQWLIQTYKTAKALDVTLTPEVRGVFDRMLSTNIEVEAAAQKGGFVAKTDAEMDALGMNELDQVYAKNLIKLSVEKAEDQLTQARNKGYRDNLAKWRRGARKEVMSANANYEIFTDIIENDNRINKAQFIERYGTEAVAALPNQRILKPVTKEDVQELQGVVELSESKTRSLEAIRKEIEQSELKRRTGKRDAEGNIIGGVVTGTGFPAYFTGKGYTKKNVLKIIDKAFTFNPLTEKQLGILNDLLKGFRDQLAEDIRDARGQVMEDKAVSFDPLTFIEPITTEFIQPQIESKNDIDSVAAYYGFDDADDMASSFVQTPKFNDAVNALVNEARLEHDLQFNFEDYIINLKEYRDYLTIMSRYITGKGVDETAVDAAIQRNVKRWETEAAEEITNESPELTGRERDAAVGARVQEKIGNFQTKKAKPRAISTDALKTLALNTINAKSVKDARNVKSYLSAMKKAASDERRAIMRKDWGAAATASELSRFNYEMASLSSKIREEVVDIQKRANRLGKQKNIDHAHKEGILHLSSRYQLTSLVPSRPQENPNYSNLFAGDEYGNNGFPMPSFLTNGSTNDYRQLRMEEMRELDSAIRYLAGQGNIQKNDNLADGETTVQDVADESVPIIETHKPRKVWEKNSIVRRASDITNSAFSWLDSLEFTLISLDGYSNIGKNGVKGPLERYIGDQLKAASNDMIIDGKDLQTRLDAPLRQIGKTMSKWNDRFGYNMNIEGVPLPQLMRNDGQTKGWHAQQIFAVVLNTGNKGEVSNYQNLLAGYPDLTPAMVEKLTNLLTIDDMRAVQGIWDAIESLAPKVEAQHLKSKNYPMSRIEATPFRFKGEDFRGGYYPIKHDKSLSRKASVRGFVEDLFDKGDAPIRTPFTKAGHEIKRIAGVAEPLLLDLGVIDAHMKDALQRIHFADPVSDAVKILRNSEIEKAGIKAIGAEKYDSMMASLKHIANPRREGLDVAGAQATEWMRGLSTLYILAHNTGVALKQPLSTYGAIHDIGLKAYIDGVSSTMLSPSAHYKKMTDLSPYMFDRLTSFDRELKSSFLTLTKEQRGVYFGDTSVTWQDVKNFGFWQIRIADTVTVLPIWHGAFNDKLLSDQSNLDEAIAYADDKVRKSQPSAQPFDLSRWQREGGVIRLFTQFQTFTVGKYGQRQRLHYRAWKNGKLSTVDYAWFNFMDSFLPLVSMQLMFAAIFGLDLDDEDTLSKMMWDIGLSWAFMGMPLVNNITRIYNGYGDPIDSPVIKTANQMLQGVLKGGGIFGTKAERDRALWGIAHTISIYSGVPVDKIISKAVRGSKQDRGLAGVKFLVPAPRKKK